MANLIFNAMIVEKKENDLWTLFFHPPIGSPYAQAYEILRIHIHPRYNSETYDHDISVITVVHEIVFSIAVVPTCLPWK